MAKTEIIYPKNVGALVAKNFTYDELSAFMAIEKIKILVAVLELPAKQHCQCLKFNLQPQNSNILKPSLKQFFHTEGQNNFKNKIVLLNTQFAKTLDTHPLL